MKRLTASITLLLFSTLLMSQNIDFTASQTTICPPDTVNFTNTSTVGDSFVWYFSNTYTYDTGLNVSHVFQKMGKFVIVLSVYDSNGNFIGNKTESINSIGYDTIIYPTIDTFCPTDPIRFAIYCTKIDSVVWEMGDGSTYTDVRINSKTNPSYSIYDYSYTHKRMYEVKAIIFSICGIDTIRKNVVINNTRQLSGNFNTVIPNGNHCPVSRVFFLAKFYGFSSDFSQIIFDYGDGDSSVVNINKNSGNSSYKYHTYTDTGTFIPRIIFRNNCKNEKIFSDTIRIVTNLREFLSDTIIVQQNNAGCDPNSISFIAPLNTTVWDFGDGHYSTNINPNHRYIYPGDYLVKAYLTNGCGYDTILSKKITIVDTVSIHGNVNISWHRQKVCPGTEINFGFNGHVNCTTNRYWILNDSMISENGNFTFHTMGENIIKLVFEYPGKKDYIVTDTVIVVNNIPFQHVNPYSSYACTGDVWFGYSHSSQFTISRNKWLFSTGDSSLEKHPIIHFDSSGKYSFTLHLTNSCGFDTVFSDTFEIADSIPPVLANINLNISNINICPAEETTIYANYYSSNTLIDSSILSIDDSVIENYENYLRINKVFSKPGKYPVSIRLVNTCGNDTVVSDTIVVSNSNPVDTKDFSIYTADKSCFLDTSSIRVYVYRSNLSYQIEIDDTLRDPGFHHYYSTGFHNIKYHFENSCGQKLIVEDSIEIVNKLPIEDNVFFGTIPESHLIYNELISFYCSYNENNGYFPAYKWNFGDGDSMLGTSMFSYHFYENPGNYLVKLRVENLCGTSKSYSKSIKVDSCRNLFLNTPIDIVDGGNDFYINKNIVNYSFSFRTNLRSEYCTIKWDFGDGNTSNFPKPTHSYSKEGVYHVKLKLTNKCGFSTILRDSVIVLPTDTYISRVVWFSSLRDVCPNQLINIYSKGIYESDSVYFVINNLDTIFKTHFNYSFDNVGDYLIKQIVFDANNNKFTFQDTIKVSHANNFTSYSINPRTFSSPIAGVPFRVFFEKGIHKLMSIDFGDGTVNSNPDVFYYNDPIYQPYDSIYLFTHTYKKSGTYTIKVNYRDACYNFDSSINHFVVRDSNYQYDLLSGLYWDKDNCYVGENIDFFPYGGDYYIFDFGDATTQDTCFDELEPLSHTYLNAGTYMIKCKVIRNYNPDETIYKYIIISDDNMKAVVDFSVSRNFILLNDTVSFFEHSYPGKTDWHWTLDGTSVDSSILQNPSGIRYTKAGTFDVTLRVKNSYGWTSLTKPNYITVVDSTPKVNFVSDSTVIFRKGTVDFTDLSTNIPTHWKWEFEGGLPPVSMNQNPTNITYNDTGTFAVKLVVSNQYGKDSMIKTSYIKVLPMPKPYADFSSDKTTIFETYSVNFFDESTNNPTFWKWEFEGGTPNTSLLENPKNIFYNDTGSFKVNLFVSNQFGKDSLVKEDFIQVLEIPLPEANFTSDTNVILRNSSINFFDLSSNIPNSWKWEFEGGIPANSNYQNPVNIFYTDTGLFDVKLIVSNDYGTDSVLKTNCIKVLPYEKPNALFDADTTKIYSGEKVNFSNKSTGYITYTKWYFEGGKPDSSILNSPAIQYNSGGEFNVRLIVGNQDGFDTLTKTDYITVDTINSLTDRVGELVYTIYPNPFDDYIFIRMENTSGKEIQVSLLNINGEVLLQKNINPDNNVVLENINTGKIAQGTYILRISANDFILNKSLLRCNAESIPGSSWRRPCRPSL